MKTWVPHVHEGEESEKVFERQSEKLDPNGDGGFPRKIITDKILPPHVGCQI